MISNKHFLIQKIVRSRRRCKFTLHRSINAYRNQTYTYESHNSFRVFFLLFLHCFPTLSIIFKFQMEECIPLTPHPSFKINYIQRKYIDKWVRYIENISIRFVERNFGIETYCFKYKPG